MSTSNDRPWLRYYGGVPASIGYPRCTPYQAVAATAQRLRSAIAWDFMGTKATYRELLASIDICADALAALGLGAGDRLLISMPSAPGGVIAVYAAPARRGRLCDRGARPGAGRASQGGGGAERPAQESEATAQTLIDFCAERLITWSRPREIEFRRGLPQISLPVPSGDASTA